MLHKCHISRQPLQRVAQRKTERLPPEAFEPKARDESMGFQTIASTTQATSWYSPSAPNMPVSSADVAMVKCTNLSQQFTTMCTSWHGLLSQVHHQLVFCKNNAPQWTYLCLDHFKERMVLVLAS